MNRKLLLLCLLWIVGPYALAADPHTVTLESLEAEVRALRRLVNDLIVARCEIERATATATLESLSSRLRTVDRQRAELEEERDNAETDTERAVEIDAEMDRLEREVRASLEAARVSAEDALREIVERCHPVLVMPR